MRSPAARADDPDVYPIDPTSAAIEASRRALGVSSPNPPVGAAVVDASGELVATGATEPVGGRHAEAVALDAAGHRARGGTLAVTLEPCAHTGRTGPCTQRILDAGVRRVVYGVSDPNPLAAGGAEILRHAGVETEQDPAFEQIAEHDALRPWLHRQVTGRPLVTWKYAASLDGFVAASDGTSRWITGETAREHAHRRRETADAILVGSGTLAADDPTLSARNPDGSPRRRSPLACVMGLSDVPDRAAIRTSPGGFRHLRTRDPQEALTMLPDALHVILEGGPTIAGAFLTAGLVDEIDAYLAPIVLGAGRSIVEGADAGTLAAAPRFTVHYTVELGADVFVRLVPPVPERERRAGYRWTMDPPSSQAGSSSEYMWSQTPPTGPEE